MLTRIRSIFLAAFITCAYWLHSRTWRVIRVRPPGPPEKGRARLYAHWHGDELVLVGTHTGSGMAVMASRSRDGEMMKHLLTWLGYRVVRGSSTRGGAGGLKGLIDLVTKEGRDASLAVDGPRGPIYKVKPGIIKLAQETGCELVPGVAAASRRFVFKNAWNRCYLPLPFSKCVIVFGEPLQVPPDIDDSEFEKWRALLEHRLRTAKVEAEAMFARSPDPALLKKEILPTGV